ncbi:PRC-barrel domain-containing protein [Legionella lansingensis]|uniref:PRC-barrel domain protein n=1 Tax=Legionella lansingensis TaxID=45067 RepID=A0A0W0VJ84_9GAMM|nr:PRC-barrel domain-containing protein [Legionella lansingensis]KTD19949.1 PRC-barrel domain protein [Legionella lansingensis]SNV48535.1 PRC-barrel domain-containing protein [Legionella lansingensis]
MVSQRSIVKASEVTGVCVKNMAGKNLGTIHEVVIDKAYGKVNYVVLEFGGILGFGNKYFALPWHLFKYDKIADCFIIDIDKERLINAPGFDKDHWPDFAAPEFATKIHKYYE